MGDGKFRIPEEEKGFTSFSANLFLTGPDLGVVSVLTGAAFAFFWKDEKED